MIVWDELDVRRVVKVNLSSKAEVVSYWSHEQASRAADSDKESQTASDGFAIASNELLVD